MQGKKKILIIAHFCDYGKEETNNRFNYLAEKLTQANFDVELVTSSFSHRGKNQRCNILNKFYIENTDQKYKIALIYEPSYKKNISLRRLFISHKILARNLKRYLKICTIPDLVYCAIPSINVAEVASDYAKKIGVPFWLDIQDIWPDAYRLLLKNELIFNVLCSFLIYKVNEVYKSADQIIAVSETYAKRAMIVNKKCIKPLCVYLGTNKKTFDEYKERMQIKIWDKNSDIWLVYCGTLGRSYDLCTVFKALKLLNEQGIYNVKFIIIGNGPEEEELKRQVKQLRIPCIFTGKLPYSEICAILTKCDIAINSIRKGAMQSIINKHADYAMAGLPVINNQECEEYRNLLEKYSCGINCQPEDEISMYKGILKLLNDKDLRYKMGNNSRLLAEKKFNREYTYQIIINSIAEVLK